MKFGETRGVRGTMVHDNSSRFNPMMPGGSKKSGTLMKSSGGFPRSKMTEMTKMRFKPTKM